MKVLIGWIDQEHGSVETSPEGLVYGGPDPDHVRELVEAKRVWYDRAGARHILKDTQLVYSLPYRLQGNLWAVFVDESTGLTQDQPPYDPWGVTWRAS
jgi:hypothetical protein